MKAIFSSMKKYSFKTILLFPTQKESLFADSLPMKDKYQLKKPMEKGLSSTETLQRTSNKLMKEIGNRVSW